MDIRFGLQTSFSLLSQYKIKIDILISEIIPDILSYQESFFKI